MGAAVGRSEAHIVKHRPCIEKFVIELETTTLSGERTPVIDAARMMEQQPRLGVPDELSDLAGEPSVRNADSFERERLFSRKCHSVSSWRMILANSPSKARLAGDCCSCVILAELCTCTLICGQVGTRWAEDQGSGRERKPILHPKHVGWAAKRDYIPMNFLAGISLTCCAADRRRHSTPARIK